jgi:RNA polymerase sigma factor (sigma-70 family)
MNENLPADDLLIRGSPVTSDKVQSYTEWLVLNSQQGNARAFDELLRSWHKRWLLYAVARLGDHEQAREALQECLLSISRSIHKLRDPASFSKWTFQIMDRRCTDLLRRRIREREHHQELTRLSLTEETATVEFQEQSLTLQRAFQQLGEPLARLLRLYYLEGFAVEEIAEIIGIPSGTVKSRLFHARKIMAKILED